MMFVVAAFLIALSPPRATASELLIETEQFEHWGGWLHDCQFMDQMGSPYLLAHGLGRPVKDATTHINIPASGEYHVWVRTRDWVATWNAPGTPGRFQLIIGGRALATTFGTEGAAWHWQRGNVIHLARGSTQLALHDLTGFEARCDAVLLTTDAQFVPPDSGSQLSQWRDRLLGLSAAPRDAGDFDLVVTGGGIAGTCASLAAARLGLNVALIQDRPVLGGNNSSEVRVWLQGARNKQPHPHVGDIVRELEQARRAHYGPANTAPIYEDDRKLALVRDEPNIQLFLNHRANAVEMDGPRIRAVLARDTINGQRRRFRGRWFVDSTGDGCIGALAGADWEMQLPDHMGRCNLWNVIDTGKPVPFPRCPWALDLTDKPFPGRDRPFPGMKRDRRGPEALGGWYWESGFAHNPFDKNEYIRDWNFRAMYGAWNALKNVDKRYATYQLNWAAYVSGKRESRRILGDVILTKADVVSNKQYPDGCVPTGWPIDVHLPDPQYEKGFEGDAFIAKAHYTQYPPPYWVPYRCLYSRNVTNLLMAGRDISVTHEALGTVRVMRTGGCMGEVVGMAASVCKRFNTDPRGVYRDHLDALMALINVGVGKPPRPPALPRPKWLTDQAVNQATTAKVSVSASHDATQYPISNLTDQVIDLTDNDGRWLSSASVPAWIEFQWPEPQVLEAVRMISGYTEANGNISAPVEAFAIQNWNGHAWQPVAESQMTHNTDMACAQRFPAIKTTRLRVVIERTQGNIARIWEIEFYRLP